MLIKSKTRFLITFSEVEKDYELDVKKKKLRVKGKEYEIYEVGVLERVLSLSLVIVGLMVGIYLGVDFEVGDVFWVLGVMIGLMLFWGRYEEGGRLFGIGLLLFFVSLLVGWSGYGVKKCSLGVLSGFLVGVLGIWLGGEVYRTKEWTIFMKMRNARKGLLN